MPGHPPSSLTANQHAEGAAQTCDPNTPNCNAITRRKIVSDTRVSTKTLDLHNPIYKDPSFPQTTQSEILERRLQGPPFGFLGNVFGPDTHTKSTPEQEQEPTKQRSVLLKEIAFRNPRTTNAEREPRTDFLEPISEVPTKTRKQP